MIHRSTCKLQIVRPKSAIIIVDVQNDFISGGLLPTNNSAHLLKNMRKSFIFEISGSLSISNCPAGHNGEDVSLHTIAFPVSYLWSKTCFIFWRAKHFFPLLHFGSKPFQDKRKNRIIFYSSFIFWREKIQEKGQNVSFHSIIFFLLFYNSYQNFFIIPTKTFYNSYQNFSKTKSISSLHPFRSLSIFFAQKNISCQINLDLAICRFICNCHHNFLY